MEMRYFFTRKLMLIKESDAYVVLPGGFGTQDECYELLTLLQTGKAEPAPVVLVETPGGTYWRQWVHFLEHEAVGHGYVSPDDLALLRIATTVDDAAREIFGFYRNYHSCRWVGDLLVIRLGASRPPPSSTTSTGSLATSQHRGRSGRPRPWRRSAPATTTSTSRGSPCASTRRTTAGSG